MRCWLAVITLAACTGPNATHIPELGRYNFTGSFSVPGFTALANLTGQLTVTSANSDALTWTLDIPEPLSTVHVTDVATWDEANGYLLLGIQVHQAGTWSLILHFERDGSDYRCSGKAITNSYPPQPGSLIHNETMTCSFDFLGPGS